MFIQKPKSTLALGRINLTLDNAISRHVELHGDGIYDVALQVDDVETVFHAAVKRGGRSILPMDTSSKQ